MKLLFARCCNTLVVPDKTKNIPRYCDCKSCACWWEDPQQGHFVIAAKENFDARIIGIHNGALSATLTKQSVKTILDETPSNYLFKTINSLIVNIYPGTSFDTRFAKEDELEELEKLQLKL